MRWGIIDHVGAVALAHTATRSMDTQASAQDRLFICHMPTGLAYCDRSREEHGDYKRIANLYWHDLTFVPAKGASGPLLDRAREHAATYQARRGEAVQVSASGQTTVLGRGIPELKIGQNIWAKNNPEWGMFTVVAIEPEWYEIRGRAGVRVLSPSELYLWRLDGGLNS